MHDGVILETCSKSSEYMQYRNLTNILDAASKISYWKIIGCIPRCKYTKYVLGPLYDSNFDQLKYLFNQSDGANNEFFLVFIKSEIDIIKRIWIYDFNNLLADIGGFLGLLLGASIYTFADVLVASVEKLMNK